MQVQFIYGRLAANPKYSVFWVKVSWFVARELCVIKYSASQDKKTVSEPKRLLISFKVLETGWTYSSDQVASTKIWKFVNDAKPLLYQRMLKYNSL